jgi:hypothetical protein
MDKRALPIRIEIPDAREVETDRIRKARVFD